MMHTYLASIDANVPITALGISSKALPRSLTRHFCAFASRICAARSP